jgi:dinuclear metal center YbgI/SA1388 family protein
MPPRARGRASAPTVAEVVRWLDRFAPPQLAAEWDNTGLLLGDAAVTAPRILTCLTVTPAVVAEAVDTGVQLIVTHHPILFKAVKKLTSHTPDGRMLLLLAQAGVAVYSPHTSFDNCVGGINDSLAAAIGLTDVSPLRLKDSAKECKLVVFVPGSDLAKVSDAIFAAGGGIIGQYEQCSYRLSGTGTFFGTESSNPTVGQKGRREEVSEWRLEVVVPDGKVEQVVSAMRAAHSYEEPAFDVYPLRPKRIGGEGRIGTLPAPLGLDAFASSVKTLCRANGVQVVGAADKAIRTVAVACGAAGEYLNDAIRRKADAFVTGEVRFHDCLTAEAAGVALVLPGHYATERPAVEALATKLAEAFPTAIVAASQAEQDPLRNI